MEKSTNHFKFVIAGLGVACIGGLIYFWKKRQSKNDHHHQVEQDQSKSVMTFEQKYEKVTAQINRIWEKNHHHHELSGDLIKAIYRGQYELANDSAKQLILKSRTKRRANIENKAEYCRICLKYDKKLEQDLDKQLNSILARFKIDKMHWINETMRWSSSSEQASDEWVELLRVEDAKQLDSLRQKYKHYKSYTVVKNALQYKIKQLQVVDTEQLFTNDEMDQNEKFHVLECFTDDLIFEKFAIQPEDIDYSISNYKKQEQNELEELRGKITELITSFIYAEESDDDHF